MRGTGQAVRADKGGTRTGTRRDAEGAMSGKHLAKAAVEWSDCLVSPDGETALPTTGWSTSSLDDLAKEDFSPQVVHVAALADTYLHPMIFYTVRGNQKTRLV